MELAKAFIMVYTISSTVTEQFLSKEHVTNKAAGKMDDLWCYTCDTMEQDDRCVDLSGNHSSIIRKCGDEHRICMAG